MQAGFLAKEKPLAPISAQALQVEFDKTLSKAEELRAILDPEEEPYRSRYEERHLLMKLAKQAAANESAATEGSADRKQARSIGGAVAVLLGKNFLETEEGSTAQPRLEVRAEG